MIILAILSILVTAVIGILIFVGVNKDLNTKKYLTEGIVIDKHCNFSHTKMFSIPQIVNCGKVTTTINIPHTITYPDVYVITISKAHNEFNKPLTQKIFVSKEIFENTNIGDDFTYNKDRGDLFELPYDYDCEWDD